MPSRAKYQVNDAEANKHEHDESYKSCVLTLIIFFFLCLILILASLPWKKKSEPVSDKITDTATQIGLHDKEFKGRKYTPPVTTIRPSESTPSTKKGMDALTTNEITSLATESEEISNVTLTKVTLINNASTITQFTNPITNSTSVKDDVTEEIGIVTASTEKEVAVTYTSENTVSENVTSTFSIKRMFTELGHSSTAESLLTENLENLTSTDISHIMTSSNDDVTDSTNSIMSIATTYETTFNDYGTVPLISTTEAPTTYDYTETLTTTDIVQDLNTVPNDFSTEVSSQFTTELYDATSSKTYTDDVITSQSYADNAITSKSYTDDTITTEFYSDSTSGSKSYTDDTITTEFYTDSKITSMSYLDDTTTPKSYTDDTIATEVYTDSNITSKSSTDEAFETTDTETETFTPSTNFLPYELYQEARSSTEHEGTESQENSTSSKINSSKYKNCNTPQCKHLASKMLLYMNHSADPCEDFYEFACGGLEADPQILERNLEANAHQRILRQMRKERNERSLFRIYYNSCINYDTHVTMSHRINLAKKELDKIGTFYVANNVSDTKDFTHLFAKFILHNGALLFDIEPDLEDVYNPKYYTLRIGPPLADSLFNEERVDDPCYTAELDVEDKYVNLGNLYENYRSCKNDTARYIQSISEALEMLGVFNKYNASQYIPQTVINIDLEILKGFFVDYPTADVIRKAYLTRNYTKVTLRELNSACTLVNWTELIRLLTGLNTDENATLYVYFYEQIFNGLKKLETFAKNSGNWQLNNILMGLYTRNLYHHFVISKHTHASEACLRIASKFVPIAASRMYMSSFSSEEIKYMHRTIHSLFSELKQTLILDINEVQWLGSKGRSELIQKINDMELFVPSPDYFSSEYLRSEMTSISKLNLSDNYFLNSMVLLEHHRSLKYAGVKTLKVGPRQIWTLYATPFQTRGMSIYGLNCVIVPFGAVDWSMFFDDTQSASNYLTLATLGNLIAYQISHHFDANGIYYWNGTINTSNSLLYGSESTTFNFENYVNCQRFYPQRKPVNMSLPFTGQTVSFQISELTLNERLAEVTGLRLTYDTLVRVEKDLDKSMMLLPWLEYNVEQTFYLAYAQMYCTKMPLTSSYVSVYENEQLPSRVRVYISVSSNRPFGKIWGCPIGSRNYPTDTCEVFPYLKPKEAEIVME